MLFSLCSPHSRARDVDLWVEADGSLAYVPDGMDEAAPITIDRLGDLVPLLFDNAAHAWPR